MLHAAAGLHADGFNLLLFDFRAHGGSAGRASSFGWLEQRDLAGALVFLGQQPEIPAQPYGLYGISMGGSVGLMVAAQDERIGAIAVDSPYTNLHDSLGRHLTLLYPLPRVPFIWFLAATYRLRFGAWPNQMSPQGQIGKIAPRALLLIQGGLDRRMPPDEAQQMFKRAGQPKEQAYYPGFQA
jgi:alpha-beta hydrolase superfamily lysophospholipase